MKFILIIPVLMLAACTTIGMTNEEILTVYKTCTEGGMSAHIDYNFFNDVISVTCMPK